MANVELTQDQALMLRESYSVAMEAQRRADALGRAFGMLVESIGGKGAQAQVSGSEIRLVRSGGDEVAP